MKFYIYQHVSPSGKRYIGQTCKTPEARWQRGNGYKGQTFFNAVKKYGWENIEHEILAEAESKKEADCLERLFIAGYMANDRRFGYNATIGGGGIVGHKHTDLSREKMSRSKKELCKSGAFSVHVRTLAKKSWDDPGTRKRLEIAARTPERRKQLTEANKKSWANPEIRKHRTDGINRAYRENPEYAANVSKALRKSFSEMTEEERSRRAQISRMNGKKASRPVRQIKDGIVVSVFDSVEDAARHVGRSHCSISDVLHGRTKTCAGFYWEYE